MNPETFAKDLAREAGSKIHRSFHDVSGVAWKDDNTPVSDIDHAINDYVIRKVNEHCPDHGVIGEETSHNADNDTVWVCDPVDGTTPYTHGIPTATFVLARVNDGKPTHAVIYDPWQNRLYYAQRGEGCTVNGEPVTVNDAHDLANAVIGFEASKRSDKYASITGVEDDLAEQGTNILKLMSANYEAMLVASGELNAVIFGGTTVHDAAAAKLIVEEAGGTVTSLHGTEQRYDQRIKGFIASNGSVHDDLTKRVDTYLGADQ